MTNRNASSVVSRVARNVALTVLLSMLAISGATADSQPNMGSGMEMPEDAPLAPFSFGAPGASDAVHRVVNVTMGDMNFDSASIEVMEGETIRFIVTNKSEVDHDFTLGDFTTQVKHRAEMVSMMDAGATKHGDDPNAILVNAGQRQELVWKFARAGSLEFDCNIPGHYEAGMRGVITVRSTTPL